jgi:outer membrane protein assembly factor BamB
MRINSSTFRWPLVLLALLLTSIALGGCLGGGQIPAESWPGLAVDGEMAYVAFTRAVYAVDIQSGREVWRFSGTNQENIEIFYAPPALTADNTLVVGAYDGKVFVINASNGVPVADELTLGNGQGRIIGGPVVDGDYAYIPSTDGCLYSYDIASGIAACMLNAEGAIWASPLISDGTIYVASLDHAIYALEQESGDPLWSKELSAAIAAAPALVDDLLIVPTLGKGVIALDAADGSIRWEFETGGWVWGTPAITDEVVYFADAEGFVYAVDAGTGEELWSFQPDGPIIASPLIDGEFLFLSTTDGVLVREAADNLPLWQVQLDGRQLTRPAVSGDTLIIASIESSNLLDAYIIDSGTSRWSYDPADYDPTEE